MHILWSRKLKLNEVKSHVQFLISKKQPNCTSVPKVCFQVSTLSWRLQSPSVHRSYGAFELLVISSLPFGLALAVQRFWSLYDPTAIRHTYLPSRAGNRVWSADKWDIIPVLSDLKWRERGEITWQATSRGVGCALLYLEFGEMP
jgi:hypothetical protein